MIAKFRNMAHPATERMLNEDERSVIISALGLYQTECRANAIDAHRMSGSELVRRAAITTWQYRGDMAHALYLLLLPDDDDKHARVTVRY